MARKKNLDTNLDLTPFISLLSVCICFLLLTVAWFQIGALSMKQVIGGESSGKDTSNELKRSLWIYVKSAQSLQVVVKQSGKKSKKWSEKTILSKDSKNFDHDRLDRHVRSLKDRFPDVSEAFILPLADTKYADVIKIMDQIRGVGIFNLGISPI